MLPDCAGGGPCGCARLGQAIEAAGQRGLSDEVQRRCRRLDGELLASAWPAVVRVADALTEHPFTLTGGQIARLCEPDATGLRSWYEQEVDWLAAEVTAALVAIPSMSQPVTHAVTHGDPPAMRDVTAARGTR